LQCRFVVIYRLSQIAGACLSVFVCAEFLRTMNNPNEFLYFSGPLASAIAPELRKDLEPIPLLWGGQNPPQTDEIEPPLQAFGDLDDGGHLLPMSMWMVRQSQTDGDIALASDLT